MKTKMKRKTKIAMLSTVFLCLFTISFSLGAEAAADPIMRVDYHNEIEVNDLPIVVAVQFTWDSGINNQLLMYVYLDYSINNKEVISNLNRVTYSYLIQASVARPETVILTIPATNIDANDTVYFKITYIWKRFLSSPITEASDNTYRVDILYEGEVEDRARNNLILYICLGSAGAVVLIILALIRRKRR